MSEVETEGGTGSGDPGGGTKPALGLGNENPNEITGEGSPKSGDPGDPNKEDGLGV